MSTKNSPKNNSVVLVNEFSKSEATMNNSAEENIAIKVYKIRRLTLSIGFSEARLASQLDMKCELAKEIAGEDGAQVLESGKLQTNLTGMIALQKKIKKTINQLKIFSAELCIEENELQAYLNKKAA